MKICEIGQGKIYMEYGPSAITIAAFEGKKGLTGLCKESFVILEELLTTLSKDLVHLKQYPARINRELLSDIGKRMFDAVVLTANPTMTPMAAVAGSVSDMLAQWIFDQGATKVIVNNGGDIALRLSKDEEITVGILPDLLNPRITQIFKVKASDGIGGIATSGLYGRSLTKGIANSVSVFAKQASIADAMASQIANASYVVSPHVQTKRAGEIDPDSDIADQDVVVSVAGLTASEKKQALLQIELEAKYFKEQGLISLAAAEIDQEVVFYPLPRKDLVKQFYELP